MSLGAPIETKQVICDDQLAAWAPPGLACIFHVDKPVRATMHKPRRVEVRYWLGELQRLAERSHTRVFAPIGDLASVAAWRLDGHPYAGLAEEILRATNSA